MNLEDVQRRGGIDTLVAFDAREVGEARATSAASGSRRLPALAAPLRWFGLGGAGRLDGRPPSPLVSLVRGFTLWVLVPSAICALYLFAIAADQYVVEARFSVRGITEPLAQPNNMVSMVSVAGSSSNNNQDGFIVQNYIDSLPLVLDVDKALDLRHMFSRGETDFWTRFDRKESAEELVKYWRKRVTTRVDAISGIITLEVRAFTPADGLAVANLVLKRSEDLVNEMSRRARLDTIARSQEETEKAEARLRAAHLALQGFRNQWGIIDPAKSAEATLQTLVGLRREKLKLENDLQVLRGSLDERSRSVQTIVATLQAVDHQIAGIQSELTSEGVTNTNNVTKTNNVTQAILEYEGHMVERTVAEKIYDSARGLLDRARVMAEKQQVYLTTFVQPSLPEDSIYPKRWTTLFTLFFCFLVGWSIVAVILAGVRDHRI